MGKRKPPPRVEAPHKAVNEFELARRRFAIPLRRASDAELDSIVAKMDRFAHDDVKYTLAVAWLLESVGMAGAPVAARMEAAFARSPRSDRIKSACVSILAAWVNPILDDVFKSVMSRRERERK